MNREKLARIRVSWRTEPERPGTLWHFGVLLDALLEGGDPASTDVLVGLSRRIGVLEERPPDVEPKPFFHRPPYGFDHPWTDRCPVECLKPDVEQGATLTDEAFTARLRSGQPWMNEWRRATEKAVLGEITPPVTRGATPCPVCGTYICLGDPKACDQRAAARKAKG